MFDAHEVASSLVTALIDIPVVFWLNSERADKLVLSVIWSLPVVGRLINAISAGAGIYAPTSQCARVLSSKSSSIFVSPLLSRSCTFITLLPVRNSNLAEITTCFLLDRSQTSSPSRAIIFLMERVVISRSGALSSAAPVLSNI